MPSRQIIRSTLILLLFLLVAWWLWGRLTGVMAPVSLPTVAGRRPSEVTRPGGTPGRPAPPGYRLAGIALGEPDSFAVVESPNGTTGLYRLRDAVDGLGQVVRIEAERILVRGDREQFELWLTAAPTPTPAPTRAPKAATTKRPPRSPAGGTAPAPGSSAAPGPPAS